MRHALPLNNLATPRSEADIAADTRLATAREEQGLEAALHVYGVEVPIAASEDRAFVRMPAHQGVAGEPARDLAEILESFVQGHQIGPFYQTHLVRSVRAPGADYLLVLAHHDRSYPTQVLLLDPAIGVSISEYWHPGHLYAGATLPFDLDRDGTLELILGGVNNPGHGAGRAVILVLSLPFGQPRGLPNLFGPENSLERSYLVLPRTDMVRDHGDLLVVTALEPSRDHLTAIVRNPDSSVLLMYEFDLGLRLTDLRIADTTIRVHDSLYDRGWLDHLYSPDELSSWRAVHRFPTAPDANAPEIRRLFP